MQEDNKRMRIKTALVIAGAYISYSIGAGFGSGVELMQFFGVHGARGFLGLAVTATLSIALVFVLAHDCCTYELSDMNIMYKHYCGKYLGVLIRWYAVIIIFAIAGGMIAGGAETLNTTFHIDMRIGTVVMLIVVAVTAAMGLKKLIDVLGMIAPVILGAVLIVCIASYLAPSNGFAEGNQILQGDTISLRISNNIIWAGILSFSYAILGSGSYISSTASRNDLSNKEVIMGNTIGQVIMQIFQALILLAFILNASSVVGSGIPVLNLARRLGSGFSLFYGVILMLAIYTTATGMCWVVSANLVKEDNKWYKPVVVLVCVSAYALSLVGTFAELMNKVMSISSYVGFVFVACIIISKIYRGVSGKKESKTQNIGTEKE